MALPLDQHAKASTTLSQKMVNLPFAGYRQVLRRGNSVLAKSCFSVEVSVILFRGEES